MKHSKLKLMAAAVALAAAGGANAAMDGASTLPSGGSLYLVVGSQAITTTAVFDLGYSAGGFQPSLMAAPGVHIDWNLSTGAVNSSLGGAPTGNNWSAAWSALSAQSDLKWGVIGYMTGAAGQSPAVKNMIITSESTVSAATITATTTTQFGNMQTAYTNLLNANNSLGTHVTDANGASTASTGSAYAFQTFGTQLKPGATTWSMADVIGDSMMVNYIQNTGETQFGNSAVFSLAANGVLSYDTVAAVPEPETYGMLAAGLLMLAAVARRRRQNG